MHSLWIEPTLKTIKINYIQSEIASQFHKYLQRNSNTSKYMWHFEAQILKFFLQNILTHFFYLVIFKDNNPDTMKGV